MPIRRKKVWIVCLCAAILLTVGFIRSAPYRQSERMVQAVRQGDRTAVTQMLEAGISPDLPTAPFRGLWRYVNAFLEFSPTCPLSEACRAGDLEMVELLLECGADPAVTEQEGMSWSALSSAILGSRHEDCVAIVRLLIDHGANPCSESDGYLPVELAAMELPMDAEHAARILELVDILLGDLDVDHADGILLRSAARNGNLPLVEYLLSIGADPTIRTDDGTSAYDLAVMWEHEAVAQLLKDAQ